MPKQSVHFPGGRGGKEKDISFFCYVFAFLLAKKIFPLKLQWTDLGHVLTYEPITLQILQIGLDLGYIHMSGVLMEHGLKAGINVLPKKLRGCSNNNGEVILFW